MESIAIAKVFVQSTIVVLSTMAKITPVQEKPFVKHSETAIGDITAIVSTVDTQKRRGSIAVTFTLPVAMSVMYSMLGNAVQDVQQDSREIVGEVINMISGHARSQLARKGILIHGSTPTIFIGEKHKVKHLGTAPVIVIPFTTPDGGFVVEFCLTTSLTAKS